MLPLSLFKKQYVRKLILVKTMIYDYVLFYFHSTPIFCNKLIGNSNWAEWSTIQGVIAQVISKSDKRETRGRFENISAISNSNWIEWSTIQEVIARVISKSDEREARGRGFENTSAITP